MTYFVNWIPELYVEVGTSILLSGSVMLGLCENVLNIRDYHIYLSLLCPERKLWARCDVLEGCTAQTQANQNRNCGSYI